MSKYYDWFRRLGPLPLVPFVCVVYFAVKSYLPETNPGFNNWYGVFLQIAGGFQLVLAIDTNLKGFTGRSILQALLGEARLLFRSFPLWARQRVVTASGTIRGGAQVEGAASIRVKHNHTDLTKRVEFLERQLESLQDQLDNRMKDLVSKLNEQKKEMQKEIAALTNTSSQLRHLITDVAVGDINGQITGFLIVVIGTVISAIE